MLLTSTDVGINKYCSIGSREGRCIEISEEPTDAWGSMMLSVGHLTAGNINSRGSKYWKCKFTLNWKVKLHKFFK